MFTYVKLPQGVPLGFGHFTKKGGGVGSGEDRTAMGRQEGVMQGPSGCNQGFCLSLSSLPCAQESGEKEQHFSKEVNTSWVSAKDKKGTFHQHLVHFEKTSKQEWLLERGH